MKERIREFAKQLNIEYTGFAKVNDMSAIVCLFPYFSGIDEDSNISVYTYSKDYHKIISNYLNRIITFLKEHFGEHKYLPYSDISPYNDREIAVKAGLGFMGTNNLLINEKYGTFVFIGYILTDLEIEPDEPLDKCCLKCGKCLSNCPTQALSTGDYSVCLSEITQKKGELSPLEKQLIKDNPIIFGCDKCQMVCPHNTFLETPIIEFKTDLITKLSIEDFEGLSNKEFKAKYGDRAFAWRGKSVLLRNLSLD